MLKHEKLTSSINRKEYTEVGNSFCTYQDKICQCFYLFTELNDSFLQSNARITFPHSNNCNNHQTLLLFIIFLFLLYGL